MLKTILSRPCKASFSENSGLPPLMQRIYVARGVTDLKTLDYALAGLEPYDSLSGIQDAAKLLLAALKGGWRIVVVGDFDVDGATGTTLACRALAQMGAKSVGYYIPNRMTYGYGLSSDIVPELAKLSPDLIVTVDNGISSIQGVLAAKAAGFKVLVTDHHLPGSDLPAADVIVNPNLAHDAFPSKALAGVGVVFYVMLALRRLAVISGWFKASGLSPPNMAQFLDLVALGTVADLVPLDRNNRVLVHQGLQRIRAGICSPGLHALMRVAGRSHTHLATSDLGFALAPRLNAAGRLDDMSVGVACLMAADEQAAMQHAMQLDALNLSRRQIESDMKQDAHAIVAHLKLQGDMPMGLCLYDASWHQGVVGLVASRLKDLYNRPVVIFADAGNALLKGSGRSIRGLHLRDILAAIDAKHPGLIQAFGGHAMAAGLSLASNQLAKFKRVFDQVVKDTIDPSVAANVLLTDGELLSDEMTLDTAMIIAKGGPWGQAFEEPLFHGVFYVLSQRLVGSNHLKLSVKLSQAGAVYDAIAFNVDTSRWPNHRCESLKLVYRLDLNRFQGRVRLQLLVEYLEVMEHQA